MVGVKLEGDFGSKLEGDSGLALNLKVPLVVNLKVILVTWAVTVNLKVTGSKLEGALLLVGGG